MGVEEETGDGHRVYWPERRMVTVERSIRFTFNDEVIVGVLPLEGEDRPATQTVEPAVKRIVKLQTTQSMEPATETPETVTVQPEEELGLGNGTVWVTRPGFRVWVPPGMGTGYDSGTRELLNKPKNIFFEPKLKEI
jgi:hypothetical protein